MTDFGIARLAEAAPLTATGQVLGTGLLLLSPEQASGDPVSTRAPTSTRSAWPAAPRLAGRFPFEADLASAVLVAQRQQGAAAALHTCCACDRRAFWPTSSIAAWRRIPADSGAPSEPC